MQKNKQKITWKISITAFGFNCHAVGIKRNFLLTAPDFFFLFTAVELTLFLCVFLLFFDLRDLNEHDWLAAVFPV